MSNLLQLCVSGLSLGTIYALIALGFVVIYRASTVFNFAHGEFLSFGAFCMVSLCAAGLPWGISLATAMVLTGALGAAVERVVLRPMIGRPVFVTIIVTIFVGAILRSAIFIAWGPQTRGMPTPWDPLTTFEVAGASLLANSVAAVAAGACALAAFFALVRRTKLGVAMRATASDQETALALGVPVGRVFAATWFLAGLFAALAGVFLGMFPRSVDTNLGFVALRAFPAVIVGGLDSAWGTVLAGVLLGVLEVLCQGYVNPHLGEFGKNLHAVFPYVVMILFLIVRPHGLFGTREVERV
ncbi:MAG: branched-chain amino acid ABC transporter permease [Planctomycetota bacterium]|jgi:branched-chain amino acid transport system permease protein|nr:branched-chain amino acid ABC transporter permease [Planctomycetota bacterium]MDP6764081.1 branched-chain amino acid ABC transporter permease [Planctomycetota bacterium]MDP6989797.1 branched-chain amino acid ABC transporter permease [Planctomycetota bacterium]